MSDELDITEGRAADVVDLRLRVLRSHLPGSPLRIAEDESPGTVHLVARRGGAVVGIVTYFLDDAPHRPGEPAMRFRGMAVDASEQGRGTGTLLMRRVIDAARSQGVRLLWANGRDTAEGFYRGLGFDIIGESFLDPVSLLPHHVISLDIEVPA